MPKKTRLQKVKAKSNRAQKTREIQSAVSFVAEPRKTVEVSESPEQSVKPVLQKKKVFSDDEVTRNVFKQELSKTLMITIFIICIQVGLYVLQISGTIDVSTFITF